jgi:pimeloyl-ACP methyl ester carboxylesterase
MPRSLFDGAVKQLAERLDLVFSGSALVPRNPAAALAHEERARALQWVEAFYNRPEYFAQPETFFAELPAIAPERKRVRGFGRGGEVIELRWRSEFEPLWSELAVHAAQARIGLDLPRIDRSGSLRDKYLGVRENGTCVARWYRHSRGARACAVLLHGYMGGNFTLEERMFPVRKLFAGGLDVVLTVLPFHGCRRDLRRGLRGPAFPSSDPRFTIEGFRQLVQDHRALFSYLQREGAGTLGVIGTSLGGYSSALLATLEPRLRFAVLFIALGSIGDFIHGHGGLPGAPEQQTELHGLLQRAQRVVSPIERPSLVARERVVVIAGEVDRVTGLRHSQLLAEHFEVPVHTFPGGHILQLGRAQGFAPAFEMLAQAGLYAPRAG